MEGLGLSRLHLEDRVAVVTGATGGWGRGAAFALAAQGARVIVNARTDASITELVAAIAERGGDAVGVVGDVNTLEGARSILQGAIGAYGRLDVLVNCAGGGRGGALLDVTEAEWSAIVATELNGVFHCSKAAAEQMVAQGDGGRIVTVAGGAGMYGSPGDAAHAAVKGAVASATWSWAAELAPFGITVNAVRGGVRSAYVWPRIERFRTAPSGDASRASATPRDFGFYEPEEAGPIVAWLASAEAGDVTGCYLGIDGPCVTYWHPSLPQMATFHQPRWTPEAIEDEVGPRLRRILASQDRPIRPSDLLVAKYDMSEWSQTPVPPSGRGPNEPFVQ
jgi:NAD(P)-dependent dehydrogenase (short-subunit alcohol dehydrogenase family)